MSSQSKDNTCPTCGSTDYRDELGLCVNACHLRSGQQKDKPRREWPCATCKSKAHSTKQHDLADSFEDKPTNWEVMKALYYANLKPTDSKPDYAPYICRGAHCKCLEGRKGGCTNYHNGDHTCPDSKPEKPCPNCKVGRVRGVVCQNCDFIQSPFEPEQLREILIKLAPDLTDVEHIKLMQAIEALISQREQEANDRGVKDGKAAGSLAAFLEIKAYGSYALDRQYCDEPFIVVPVSELDEAISVFGDELKSKGEVK